MVKAKIITLGGAATFFGVVSLAVKSANTEGLYIGISYGKGCRLSAANDVEAVSESAHLQNQIFDVGSRETLTRV